MTPPTTPQRIAARHADIGGGVTIRRVLPTRGRRHIGAWCFLDHAGPTTFESGGGMQVGPHPHIGLQTFTWMLEGEVEHRDSLGTIQTIRPGEVNLMTAGRGISHTEYSQDTSRVLHAAQLWIALPPSHTDCDPAFDHYPQLPRWQAGDSDVCCTLLAGHYDGRQAPTRLYSPLMALDLASALGATVEQAVRTDFEYGVLVLTGHAIVNGVSFDADELAYLEQGAASLTIRLSAGCRVLLLGGAPTEHDIVMWWNFVGVTRDQVVQAQRDWEAGHARFGQVEGCTAAPLVAPPLPWV